MKAYRILEDHHAANKKVAIDSKKSAAVSVKEEVGGDCKNSVDGTWQKLCWCCHRGVVMAISTDTEDSK